jgi:uncharacterized protein (TIGR03067 family)
MKNYVASFVSKSIITTGLGLLLASPSLSRAADAVTEKALQGVWQGARFGEGKGEDPSKGIKLEIAIEGKHIKCKKLPNGEAEGEGDFTLSADGKAMDATGITGRYKDKLHCGAVKIEGDTLLWCVNTSGKTGDRPTEFVGDRPNKNWLVIMKRQKQ